MQKQSALFHDLTLVFCFLFYVFEPRRFETSVVAVMDQKWGKSTGGPEHIWHNDVTVTPIFDVVVYIEEE